MWPAAGEENDNVELSVTKGYCSVAINSENMDAQAWYDMIVDTVESRTESDND